MVRLKQLAKCLRKLQRKIYRKWQTSNWKKWHQNLHRRSTTKGDCYTTKGGNHHYRESGRDTVDCCMTNGSSFWVIKAPYTQLHFTRWRRSAQNIWLRKHIQCTITQEEILSSTEITSSAPTACQCASQNPPRQLLCDLDNVVMDASRELFQYCHLMACPWYWVVWGKAYAKELGILYQGLPGVIDGTDTLDFINKDELPFDRHRDVNYGQIVCNYWEEKEGPYQAWLVVGGHRINYPGEVGTLTVDILILKLLLDSIVSTPGAKFFTADIRIFYLMTPLKHK